MHRLKSLWKFKMSEDLTGAKSEDANEIAVTCAYSSSD